MTIDFKTPTKTLFENIAQIRKDYGEYLEALSKYQSSDEYKRKSIIEKDFFWNIG